jgi:pyroglutamyl-peptidase
LRAEGIPTTVSYHAGSYLCNATLYLSHFFAETMNLKTQSAFIHLPLDYSQTLQQTKELPAISSTMAARALHLVVNQLIKREPVDARELA